MICKTNCFISIVFIVSAFWFHMNVGKDELNKQFMDLLNFKQRIKYQEIILERLELTIYGFLYGFLLSIIIILYNYFIKKEKFSKLSIVCTVGAVTFLILEEPFRSLDVGEELSFIGATIVGSLGLVGSYNHFSKSDKKNIEGISADDIELYQQAYSKEIKDRKLKNIVISTGLIGIVCALGALIVAGGVSSAISDGEPFPLP